MSKREHIKSESYIDWLKSLGCLVYLPLSSEVDLKDYISGVDIVQAEGTLQWNSSKQMYQFNVPSRTGGAAVLRNGFDKTMFTTNSFTFCMRFKKLQNLATSRTICYNLSGMLYEAEFNVAYNGSSNMTNIPDDYYTASSCTSSEFVSFYQQGQLYTQADLSGNQYYNKPSDWSINQNDKGLWFGCYIGYNTIGSYCMGEIYIFDGVLDLTTIRKIQGYE